MFIPLGGYSQYIWTIDKTENGSIERRREFGVRYVPLTDAPQE
jgi:protein-L-isoaspartate(D-aspartate) O-methyltransferase